MPVEKNTIIAGTLQTDPRSGGLKRSSGVNVLPSIAEAWAEVRDNTNKDIDWILCGYDNGSKTDITIYKKGCGGINVCSTELPENEPIFGGFATNNGRFKHFYYCPENVSGMKKGRASIHKNGVLNTMIGCDSDISNIIKPNITENDIN